MMLKGKITRKDLVIINGAVIAAVIGLFVPLFDLIAIFGVMLACFLCIIDDYVMKQLKIKLIKNGELSRLKLINFQLCQTMFQEAIKAGLLKIRTDDHNIVFSLDRRRIVPLEKILSYLDVDEKFSKGGKIREIKSCLLEGKYSKIILVNKDKHD